jgi:hypothetical protein
MKRKIFITILILIFCFPAFAIRPFDSYSAIPWIDERVRLENLAFELQRNKNEWVSLRIYIDKKTSKIKAGKRLQKMFTYLTGEKLGVEKSRISFVIFEKAAIEQTIYWVLDSTVKDSGCGNCQWIKGEDFEQNINKLFIKK